MYKWNIANVGRYLRSLGRKNCKTGLKPGLPPDPKQGQVSFIAPHTRGTEKLGHELDGIPDEMKDKVPF